MAHTRICKVPDAVHRRVMALSEEKGITFAAALEVLLERGEAALAELEARGHRMRPLPPLTPKNLGLNSSVNGFNRSASRSINF